MPGLSNVFAVAFGDYAFVLDRATLSYRLTETKTGTVWADNLPVGSLTLEERETGALSVYPFGDMALFSLSEKAGAQGKEALFGLDCLGVPVDVYVTCAERQITLTIEANRDTKTHRVHAFSLLPGLCRVPGDGASYLVLPHREGVLVRAGDVPINGVNGGRTRELPFWDTDFGVTMPFWGAVRGSGANGQQQSALALISDSAYATLTLPARPGPHAPAEVNVSYARDPERRRLEIRLHLLPGGDHVSIARTYREKIIGDRQHVTLRRRARERPAVNALLGGALVTFPMHPGSAGGDGQTFADAAEIARDLKQNLGVERAVCLFWSWAEGDAPGADYQQRARPPALVTAGGDEGLREIIQAIQALGFVAGVTGKYYSPYGPPDDERARDVLAEIKRSYPAADAVLLGYLAGQPLVEVEHKRWSRWDEMDHRLARFALARKFFPLVGAAGGGDWSAIACDFWDDLLSDPSEDEHRATHDARGHWFSARLPLLGVVHHDAVAALARGSTRHERRNFLRCLLLLSPPAYHLAKDTFASDRQYVRRTYAVLGPLHGLTFPAFLTEHRFLTGDFLVEQARWSDGTRVIINQGAAEWESNDGALVLPPLGWVAEHAQMIAHDALRYNGEDLSGRRAWRIARARDNKPLTESSDVARDEFATP